MMARILRSRAGNASIPLGVPLSVDSRPPFRIVPPAPVGPAGQGGCGGVPEWLKGTDCKSVGYAYVGSNPTPSTIAFGESEWRRRDEGI